MMIIILMTVILMISQCWLSTLFFLPIMMTLMALKIFSPLMTSIPMSDHFTVDSMSVILIMLTLWITNLMVMTSMKIYYYNLNKNMFITTALILLLILMLAFSTSSIWFFYMLFEASLIPTLIIILIWGYQPERIQAGMYLMLYTVTASMPLLLALSLLVDDTTEFFSISEGIDPDLPNWIMAPMLTVGFLVKMPMYVTHLWLPKAHVEAPVAGSMILAGVLLKLGGYGLLRVLTLWPPYGLTMSYVVIPISLTGAMLTSILCIRQTDMKAMIAYSSVSHMALVITGIFTMNKWGWEGSLMMMVAHGLISSGLFATANMYYENSSSRNLMMNTGMMLISPTMAMWWFLLIAANMGAPPFINLLGEIVLMTSACAFSPYAPILLAVSSFFTVVYSMVLYSSLHHGTPLSGMNFFNMMPSYSSIVMFHVAPALLLIFSSSQILSWV